MRVLPRRACWRVLAFACAAIAALGVVGGAGASLGTQQISYTGDTQHWTVPAGVTTVNFRAYGAGGGTDTCSDVAGKGARIDGSLAVTPGEVLDITVGGAGGTGGSGPVVGAGGFGGGGSGGTSDSYGGGGGGGATTISSGGTTLVVAGGGGGAPVCSTTGGNSGAAGGNEAYGAALGGGAGTATAGGAGGAANWDGTPGTDGSFGAGGTGGSGSWAGGGGGGGGGFYGGGGGGGGGDYGAGGGGGSSYVDTSVASPVVTDGSRTGNGMVLISDGEIATPVVPPFDNLATGFTQDLVSSLPGVANTSGFGFDSQGNVYTDSLSGDLYKVDMSTTVPEPGGVGRMHPVTDLGPLTYRSGPRTGQTTYGGNFTQYPDGSVYLNSWTGLGVVRVDLATATITSLPIPNAPSGNWGIYVDPQLDSAGNHEIWYQCGSGICVIDPVTQTYIGAIPIYTDGMAIDSTGDYLFTTGGMNVWKRVGSDPSNPDLPTFQWVQNAGGNADGMSFATIGDKQVIVTNDGSNHTVSMYTFPGNDFSQPATRTVIADGNIGQYGDQANVGPDGYFYITQWYGTRFGDDSRTADASIVRLGPGGRFLPPTHSDNLSLAPATDTVASGGSEDLTATLVTTDLTTHQTVPVAGTSVSFTVVAGPDTGATDTAVTDANGHADYTLTNTNGVGDDVVHAQYVDANGQTQTSNNAVISFIVPPSPPTVTPTVTGTLGSNGWYTSDVSVHWTVGGATSTSGCDDASVTSDTSSAGTTFTCTATNGAGPTTQSVTILRDATAPTVSASATSAPNPSGWYNHDVTVHYTCTDGGSGIPDGACPADQTLTSSGSSVPVTMTDAAGNTSDPSNVVTVQIDKVAPTITATATSGGNPYTGGTWTNKNVVVHFSCTDDNSGVASVDPDATVSSQGAGQSVLGACTDAAGNTATTTFDNIQIDKTAPTVTYAGNAGTYTATQSVAITCTAVDQPGLSGLASSTCQNITGPAWSFALGVNTYSASATDNAGNVGNGSTSFTVTVDFDSLCALVGQFSTNSGVTQGLCAKLAAAKDAAARGQTATKNNIIGAFDNQLAAQAGKALTSKQAALLKSLAAAL